MYRILRTKNVSLVRPDFYVCSTGCIDANRSPTRAGGQFRVKSVHPGQCPAQRYHTTLFSSPLNAWFYRDLNGSISRKSLHSSCLLLSSKKPDDRPIRKLIDELQDEDSKAEDYQQHQKKKMEKKETMKSSSKDFQKVFIYKIDPNLGPAPVEPAKQTSVVPKQPWSVKIKEIALHYYNGFKLLYLDSKIAARLLWRIAKGKDLTRRERKQLLRTVSDVFRLVPFSVFLVVPFMEFLLPFAIRLFPGLLPSTFEDAKTREAKRRTSLKMKLEMAELLQDTIEEIAITEKGKKTDKAKLLEFKNFIERSRNEADPPTNSEILKYSKMFEDEITLDNIPDEQLYPLARIIMIPSFLDFVGRDFLIKRIRWKLRELKSDDEVIRREGIDTLSNDELQNACVARGIRAFGVPADRLRASLHQWLELSLDRQIPHSLLLLSRTLYFPSDEHLDERLKEAIRQLPERLIDEVEVKIGAEEGENVDQQTRLDILKHEEEQIEHEKELRLKKKAEEELLKTHGLIDSQVSKGEADHFSKEELIQIKETLSVSSVKEKLEEIKAEREEYIEDIEELKLLKENARESTASKRLGRRLDALLKKIEKRFEVVGGEPSSVYPKIDEDEDGIVTTDELVTAINRLPNAPDLERAQNLVAMLDEDSDGIIDLEEMRNAVRIMSTESLKDLSPVQINEVLAIARGLERVVLNDQRINKRKSNYILNLFPTVYGRASIDNFSHHVEQSN